MAKATRYKGKPPVDDIQLNAVTVLDSYPIPFMDECIDYSGKARIFWRLHFNSEYWKIKMNNKDDDKKAFVIHEGLIKYTRKVFGLKNAPKMFERAMVVVLTNVKLQFALV